MTHSQHVQAKTTNGDELSVSTHTTDAPLLPVAQLERLHQFRPDLVDFITKQTELEAEHRRKSTAQVNKFIFIERMAGILAAVFIGLCGLIAGSYVGLNGQPYLGAAIVGSALGTLAIAFLRKKADENNGRQEESDEVVNSSKKNAPSAKGHKKNR